MRGADIKDGCLRLLTHSRVSLHQHYSCAARKLPFYKGDKNSAAALNKQCKTVNFHKNVKAYESCISAGGCSLRVPDGPQLTELTIVRDPSALCPKRLQKKVFICNLENQSSINQPDLPDTASHRLPCLLAFLMHINTQDRCRSVWCWGRFMTPLWTPASSECCWLYSDTGT